MRENAIRMGILAGSIVSGLIGGALLKLGRQD
jgi:Na+/H+ antiporter NhaA